MDCVQLEYHVSLRVTTAEFNVVKMYVTFLKRSLTQDVGYIKQCYMVQDIL
jgi:hypothetical protein